VVGLVEIARAGVAVVAVVGTGEVVVGVEIARTGDVVVVVEETIGVTLMVGATYSGDVSTGAIEMAVEINIAGFAVVVVVHLTWAVVVVVAGVMGGGRRMWAACEKNLLPGKEAAGRRRVYAVLMTGAR